MDDEEFLSEQSDLKGQELYKVHFPEFWDRSYESKNSFFEMIEADAKNFVKVYHRGEEFLEGKKIGKFWHAHCEFCFTNIETDANSDCYCTKDFLSWICADCFRDFKDEFSWNVTDTIKD